MATEDNSHNDSSDRTPDSSPRRPGEASSRDRDPQRSRQDAALTRRPDNHLVGAARRSGFEPRPSSHDPQAPLPARAEESLLFTQFALDRMPLVVAWMRVRDGRFVYVNEAACRRFGFSREELLRKTVFDVDPEFNPARWAELNQQLRTGGPCTLETTHRARDGRLIPVEVTAGVLEHAGEEYHCGYAQDITERKRAEGALRESETRHRIVADNTYDWEFWTDPDGKFLYTSPSCERITGRRADEFGADPGLLLKIIHPEDRQRYLLHEQDPSSRTAEDFVEFRIIRPDGEERWVEHVCQAIFDETGKPLGRQGSNRDCSERKRGEQKLGESEEKFRRFFEDDLTGDFITTAEGIILECNPAFLKMFGYEDKSEVLGQSIDVLYPDPSERVFILDQLRSRGKLEDYETVRRRKDGGLITISENIVAGFDEAGNVIEVKGYLYDITERRRAQEKNRESEELHRAVVESTTDALVVLDPDRTIISCNPAFCTLFGYSVDEVKGESVLIIHPSEEAFRKFGEVAYELVRRTGSYRGEWNFRKKDGTIFPAETVTSGIRENSSVVGYVGVIRDVTERKKAEELVRIRLDLLEYSVTHSLEDLLQRTLDEIVSLTNSLIGFYHFISENEKTIYLRMWSTRTIKEFCTAEGKGQHYPVDQAGVWADAIRERRTVIHNDYTSLSHRKGMPEGHAVVIRELVVPIMRSGRIVAVIGIGNKPTEYTERDAEAVSYLADVAWEIALRKRAEEEREKLQAQLNQAQKMESVGRLAGGVAHDFNNKLGVIIGNVQLAMDEVEPSDPVYESLVEIDEAARRSAELVRQLLAFARRQTASPKVINLNETVSGMITMLRRLIGEDIDLAWVPGYDLWQVKIDPAQIDQILANLVVNARDAIAGVGKVSVETHNAVFDKAYCREHPGSAPGQYVLLALSDDGKGMSKDVLEHIFEPFFTTKEVGKGTGLGLATVYGIVKQNDGFINVYSEVGQGTTVRIYLPRFEASRVEVQQESEPKARMKGTETVLLVEDERAILKMGKTTLESLGYRVLTADTPQEAIRIAGEYSGVIHLLFTDVVMPQMTGRELAERLQSAHPDLKVLFMSGYTADVIAKHGVLEQGINFIEKPFSKKDLALKVRKALDRA